MLLMTKSEEIRERLLNALVQSGEWMGRDDIAEAIGKSRLNPSDLKHLEGLVEDGQAERSSETIGIRQRYLYRINS